MRKTVVLLAVLALTLPAAGVASLFVLRAGEGTLSVEDGRGTISLKARGGVIGRLDRGTVTIYDLTPEDANDPYVFGDDQPVQLVGETGIRYAGAGLRYRLVGGSFRIVISGRGIDLSAVGKGNGSIRAELESLDPGVYSLEGVDCRKDRISCKPLPERVKSFQLGTPERPERTPGPPTPS